MDSLKPIIFIHPLSETLQKLKSVVEDIAESEKIEIYEADDIAELGQLIPCAGQSLIIGSMPKKCAMVLQMNRKHISKMNSKAILLTPKLIPHKTLDKLSKIGLTEYIKEPVNPKTLLYKVKLLLRSIKVDKGDNSDLEFKKNNASENSSFEDTETQSGKFEKAHEPEEESYYQGSLSKMRSNLEADEDEEKTRKSSYQEEAKSSQLRGSVSNQDNSDGSAKDQSYSNLMNEDESNGSYRGDLSSDADSSLNNGPLTGSVSLDLEDDIDALRAEINDEIEEELDKEHHKAVTQIEEAEKEVKRHEAVREEYDGHLRGKLAELGQDEDKDKPRFSSDQEDEARSPGFLASNMDEESDASNNKKRAQSESEDGPEAKELRKPDLKENDDKDPRRSQYQEDDQGPMKGQLGSQQEEAQMNNEGDHSADRLETHYKGHTSHEQEARGGNRKGQLSSEETEADPLKGLQSDDEAPAPGHLAAASEEDSLSADLRGEIQSQQDEALEDDLNPLAKTLEEEEKDPHTGQINDEVQSPIQKHSNEENEADPLKPRLIPEIDEADDLSDRPRAEVNNPDKKPHKKADAKADKLKTHYSSQTSTLHNDQEWGNNAGAQQEQDFGDFPTDHDEFPQAQDDFPKEQEDFSHEADELPKTQQEMTAELKDLPSSKNQDSSKQQEDESFGEGSSINYGKDELGEQTINYKKLKDEFGGITNDRDGKKSAMSFSGGSPQQEKQAPIYHRDDSITEDELPPPDLSLDDEEVLMPKQDLFLADPKGLNTVIKVHSLYLKQDKSREDIFKLIAERLLEEEMGQTSFFFYNKSLKLDEEVFTSFKPDQQNLWNEIKTEHSAKWPELSLPKWSDSTFQEQENVFFYPFFEGINKLGFAIVSFQEQVDASKAKKIEVILESARGLYLLESKRSQQKEQPVTSGAKTSNKKKKKEGFFSRLFKRKAS